MNYKASLWYKEVEVELRVYQAQICSPIYSLVVLLVYNCNDSKGLITEGISDGLSRPGKPTRSHKSCSPFEVNMKVYQTP